MLILLTAAAVAAAQPAAPAPTNPHAQHAQQDNTAEHKGMDCCKDCCKDMAVKHDGDRAEHWEHSSH